MEAWGNIRSVEKIRETEKIQRKSLKTIFQHPVSTTYTGIIGHQNKRSHMPENAALS